MIPVHQLPAIGDPALDANYDDAINQLMLLKVLQCINDDRFAVQLQELLWLCADIHPLASPAGKDYRYVHR